jgi:hypothetical protein
MMVLSSLCRDISSSANLSALLIALLIEMLSARR